MARGVTLIPEVGEATAGPSGPAHRLVVRAADAREMPAAIFLYTVKPAPFPAADPTPVAEFTDVCTPADLAAYPEGAPDPAAWPGRFRLDAVDLVAHSPALLEAARAAIEDAARALVAALDDLDRLEDAGPVRLGAPDGP